MANLPADSGTASIIKRISSRNQYHCFSRTGYVCSQVVLSLLERRQGTDKPVLPRKKMLRRFLSAEGYRVLTASTGDEGLRLVRSARPDVITLDVLMPGVDGWAVLSTLKADADLAEIR